MRCGFHRFIILVGSLIKPQEVRRKFAKVDLLSIRAVLQPQNGCCALLFLKSVIFSIASHSGSDAGVSKGDEAERVGDRISCEKSCCYLCC